MPTPKLFVYKAAEANVAVLLRRGSVRDTWEMIRWDLDTDTFTEGQWLTKKRMNGKYCSLSPCGKYFAYDYEVWTPTYQHHAVISQVPNFTALYFDPNAYSPPFFSATGTVVYDPMQQKGSVTLPFHVPPFPSPLTKPDSTSYTEEGWTDAKGRVITTQDGKLLANGDVLYDTTDHVFVGRIPV
jgi:hypothetical protein